MSSANDDGQTARESLVLFEGVSVRYPNGHQALKNVNLTFPPGQFVVVVGLSGAGKSTLIRCVNRLVTPTDGKLTVAGEEIVGLSDSRLRKVRAQVGMIFQNYNLVKRSSVLRNVLAGRLAYLPTWRTLIGLFPRADVELALRCLERVGISEKTYQRADTLSGGQQQRVAIARGLVNHPQVLLADEPTGNLDTKTSIEVMGVFQKLNEQGITILMVTHELDIAHFCKRNLIVRDGLLVSDIRVENRSIAEVELKKLRDAEAAAKLTHG